jgi:hypothetical protein
MKQREQMTMDAFIARHGIRATVKEVGTRRDATEWPVGSRHFRATLHCGKRRMTAPFSQGPGVGSEPDTDTVLNAVASDASCADWQSFEDFCSEFGYDTDRGRFRAVRRDQVGANSPLQDGFR